MVITHHNDCSFWSPRRGGVVPRQFLIMAHNNLSRYIFGIRIPSVKSVKLAEAFLLKYPPATQKDYLRKFANQFGDKIPAKNFVEVLVHFFDALDE